VTQSGCTFLLLNQAGEIMNNPAAFQSPGLWGSDFAETWMCLQLYVLWIVSSDYTEVTVKAAEHACRSFVGWRSR